MSISLKPYIGTRDFYPPEMEFRNWMFGIQKEICQNFGYQNYASPTLELLDLYRAKSSSEIVGEQVYSFQDRGDREVAIRPELTPSLARMVAARLQDFSMPARLFNIGNFMRYERPGRGRLREFWQLNVDLLGSINSNAETEIVMLAIDVLRAYGADHQHFQLCFSDRRLIESWLQLKDKEQLRSICRLIDKKSKIKPEQFDQELKDLAANDNTIIQKTNELLEINISDLQELAQLGKLDTLVAVHINKISNDLSKLGYEKEIKFDPTITRGFDYYTSFVFEINDLHPDNNRALFGGGRYDKLIGLFGKQDVPAVGFGMGDVTLENFIRSHQLKSLPTFGRNGIFVALMDEKLSPECQQLAMSLRKSGLLVETALESTKKFGKQFQLADRKNRRFVIILGEDEIKASQVGVKDLETGEQHKIPQTKLIEWLHTHNI